MSEQRNTVRALRGDLRVLEREVERSLASETCACSVTVAQCHLLLEVELKGQTGITELTSALELDKSTLSRTVDALCRAGLLSRETDAANRRQQVIALTEAGKARADAINSLCDDFYARILREIPREKRVLVTECIRLLARAMRHVRNAAGDPATTRNTGGNG